VVRVGVLGPLLVTGDDGRPVEVGGGRLRALLIRLVLDAGRMVSADALIEAVWADAPPAGAAGALQTLVSRLRRLLPDASRLSAQSVGYRLDLAPEDVDAIEFERLAGTGREALAAGRPDVAAGLLGEALALWRGPALVEVADIGVFRAPAARLDEARLTATEDRIDADLQRGAAAGVVAESADLAAAHPLRERPHALLIRALYESGRPAEALREYERLRRTLADELGVDPSPELAALHTSILRGEAGTQGNLRAGLTSFVGREEELTRVAALLADRRLVTLVGPGGAGKTRLATEAARRVVGAFADGAWLIELAPVREPAEVPRALAETLRLRFPPSRLGGGDLYGRLLEALSDKRMLLILDNCEHLVGESARIADDLLGACPEVRILATSREPLAITGETLSPVTPLPTPPAGADPAQALDFPAVRLFADRAAAVRPGFAVNRSTVDAVVEICRRLDGLPLAIELATARLRTLPVDQIAARLGDRFRLLTGGSRTALPRHQTLQAVVEWSWDLLAEDERRLARWLSVFLGGCTVDDAEAVCGGDLDALSGLVDKSFVALAADRYTMLETIRVYAAERLAEAGEAETVRAAHAAHFLALAETAEPALRGPDQLSWLARLTADWENLTAALRWAVDSGDATTAVRLAAALGWFWALRSAHTEASAWLRQCLAVPGDAPPAARAVALAHHAMGLITTGDVAASRAAFAESTAIGEWDHPMAALAGPMAAIFVNDSRRAWDLLPPLLTHPDPWARAVAHVLLGALHTNAGEIDKAEQSVSAALEAFEAIGDRWGIGMAAVSLAEPRELRGDHAGAIAYLEQALALSTELGVDDDLAQVRFGLSMVRGRSGDLAGAKADLELARHHAQLAGMPTRRFIFSCGAGELARRSGDLATAEREYRGAIAELATIVAVPWEWSALPLVGLAFTAIAQGDPVAARKYVAEVFHAVRDVGDRPVQATAAEALAAIALAEGEPERAARLLGLAEAVRGVADLGNPDSVDTTRAVRAALGDRYAPIHAAGRRDSAEDAVAILRKYVSAGVLDGPPADQPS
jgi:predicted ATPase/DNA-binding SARP family transcriptional activator